MNDIVLRTNRLFLRRFNKDDIDDFFEYAQMPEIGPNCGWKPIVEKSKAIERLNQMINSDEYYAIVLKEENKVIGSISLSNLDMRRYPNIKVEDNSKELGFALSVKYWKNGYMQEIIKAFLDYAFNKLGIDVIYAITSEDNVRSARLQEKCGFTYVGKIPEVKWVDGMIVSMIQRKVSSKKTSL